MIEVEVRCNDRVDLAEADTPEAALAAARHLYDEHEFAGWTLPITTTFRVDGLVVATEKGRKP